jgi:ribonuclease HII
MSEVVGNALNIIVTPFDVAGLPEEQVAFDVITTLITSPLTNVVDV